MITPRAFRDVIGRFATGVSVMSTTLDGTVHGMTANAVSSVSLDPLLALVCVDRVAAMHDLVLASRVFALSFLHEDAEGVAVHFADPYRPDGSQQFRDIPYRVEVTGSPVLEGNVGFIDCEVVDAREAGDHLIVIGRALAIGVGERDEPLLFYRGAYRALRPEGT